MEGEMIGQPYRSQRPLFVGGAVSLALFVVCVALAAGDPTEILGLNRWIKPAKFFISIAIFLWTMAAYFQHLPGHEATTRRLSWAMIAIFAIEMIVIAGQPLRGQRSHFNISTPFDGALFSIMGAAIAVLTLLTAYVAYLYFTREIDLPPAVAWGMRLGLVVMLLGSIQGGYMSTQAGHAVGVPDGGAGLPFVNWSTEGGDLRAAHFVGLHALQAIPVFALLSERLRPNSPVWPTGLFAAVYTAGFTAIFLQALYGKPLLSF
jgi:hypothetical protein